MDGLEAIWFYCWKPEISEESENICVTKIPCCCELFVIPSLKITFHSIGKDYYLFLKLQPVCLTLKAGRFSHFLSFFTLSLPCLILSPTFFFKFIFCYANQNRALFSNKPIRARFQANYVIICLVRNFDILFEHKYFPLAR